MSNSSRVSSWTKPYRVESSSDEFGLTRLISSPKGHHEVLNKYFRFPAIFMFFWKLWIFQQFFFSFIFNYSSLNKSNQKILNKYFRFPFFFVSCEKIFFYQGKIKLYINQQALHNLSSAHGETQRTKNNYNRTSSNITCKNQNKTRRLIQK